MEKLTIKSQCMSTKKYAESKCVATWVFPTQWRFLKLHSLLSCDSQEGKSRQQMHQSLGSILNQLYYGYTVVPFYAFVICLTCTVCIFNTSLSYLISVTRKVISWTPVVSNTRASLKQIIRLQCFHLHRASNVTRQRREELLLRRYVNT